VEDPFHLTERHVRAIEAQIQLIVHDGGFGEVTLVVEKHRIARVTTTVSAKFDDERDQKRSRR